MSNKKFTELTEINSTLISASDVFAVTDVDANESKKITLANLRASVLTEDAFTENVGNIQKALNQYVIAGSGNNELRATFLFADNAYQSGSYFLDYTNFANKPTEVGSAPKIVTDVNELTNTTGFLKYDSTSTGSLKYGPSYDTAITTDKIPEGSTNKYYDASAVTTEIETSFNTLFNTFSDSFDNGDVRDSLSGTVGAFSGATGSPATANQIVISDASKYSNYAVGDTIRVFGGDDNETFADTTVSIQTPVLSGFETGSAGSNTELTIKYRICLFDTEQGTISAPIGTETSVTIFKAGVTTAGAEAVLAQFNASNFIKLNFTGSAASGAKRGALIYRQIADGASKLTAILGPKEFGAGSTQTWTDYYNFDYVSWSGKNPVDNTYDVNYPVIHFPLTVPSTALRGWSDVTIGEVSPPNVEGQGQTLATAQGSFTIFLHQGGVAKSLFVNSGNAVTITHNDTTAIQDGIASKIAEGKKSLNLNSKTYFVTSLSIPDNFSLTGSPNVTAINKVPFSGGETGSDHGNIIKSTSLTQAKNISLEGLDIDGGVTNQFTFLDSSDASVNYLLDFGTQSTGIAIDRCRIKNSSGGGIFATSAIELKITASEIRNGSTTDRFAYSPVVADGGTDTTIIGNIFKNFTDNINVSVTTKGVIANNTITNCGSGIFVYGSTFLLTSPNVLTGPANELLPSVDTLSSDFDSVNITDLVLSADYTSPIYVYQENGENFNLTQTAGSLSTVIHRAQLVQKDADGVESVYGTIRNASDFNANKSVGPVHGVRYSITEVGSTDFTTGNNAPVNRVGAEFVYDDGASGSRGSALFSGSGKLTSGGADQITLSPVSGINQTNDPGKFQFSIASATVNNLKTSTGTFSHATLKAANALHTAVGYESLYKNEAISGTISGAGAWQSYASTANTDEAAKTFAAASTVNAFTNTVTLSSHGFSIGDQVKYKNNAGTTISSTLSNDDIRYISGCDFTSGQFRLATTHANAIGSTVSAGAVSMTDTKGLITLTDVQNPAITVNDRLDISGTISNGAFDTGYSTGGTVYRVVYVDASGGDSGKRIVIAKETGSTFTVATSTVTEGSGTIAKTGHGFLSGTPLRYKSNGTNLQSLENGPATTTADGITTEAGTLNDTDATAIPDGTIVFVVNASADSFQICAKFEDAVAGTNIMTFSNSGNNSQTFEQIGVTSTVGTLAGAVIKRHTSVNLRAGTNTQSFNRAGNNPEYKVTLTAEPNFLTVGKHVILSTGSNAHSGFSTDTNVIYGEVKSVSGNDVTIIYYDGGRIFDVSAGNALGGGAGNANGLTVGTGGTLNIIDTFVMAKGTIT